MSDTPDFLTQMALSSAARVAHAKNALPDLEDRLQNLPMPPKLVLSPAGFDLIMELKLASPAYGSLANSSLDLQAQVLAYARAGAAAVSVLTEPSRFQGDLLHLSRAAEVLAPSAVPAMRKDFLVDPYQLLEARLCGASGVLLIVRMLTDESLSTLLSQARRLGLFVLLETFDEIDIKRAQSHASSWAADKTQLLIGVNSRDLTTLKVVPDRLVQLASLLPMEHPRVAESGLVTAQDAAILSAAGYNLALVGSALMASADPVALGGAMIEAGRAAACRRLSEGVYR